MELSQYRECKFGIYLEFVNKDNLNIMKYVYQNWLMIKGNTISSLLTGITLIDSLKLELERLIEVILWADSIQTLRIFCFDLMIFYISSQNNI